MGSLRLTAGGMIPVEKVTGGVPVVDTNHAQIHAGNAFSLAYSGSLTQAQTKTFTFTVPSGVYVHFQAFDITSDGGNGLTIDLFDETILNATPAGTLLTPINRHRDGQGKRAVGVLTFSGTATDTQTATIGSKVYTFKSTLSGAADEILIGANAAASVANFVAAINGASGAGSTYGTGTVAHTDVVAYDGPGDTVGVVAKSAGVGGNAIATTETLTNASWGAATLTGGLAGDVSSTSQVTVRIDPTTDYIGYEQFDKIVLFKQGSVTTKTVSSKQDSIEWVVKAGRTFSVRFTADNVSGTVNYLFRPFWYEEPSA